MEKYKKMLSICGNVRTTKDYKKLVYNYIKENQDAVKEKITVFQTYKCSDIPCGGFCWGDTIEGHDFWNDVIRKENFDRFFERYAKRYPLHLKSKAVYIRGDVNNGANVIKELERRGGINHHKYFGDVNGQLYFIDPVTNYIVKANENLEIPLQNLLKTVYTEISPSEDAIVELTMQEIAEKLGVDVNKLRIKK